MRKILTIVLALLPSLAWGQAANLQQLPPNTAVGRLGVSPGPAQVIPFSDLANSLAPFLPANPGGGGGGGGGGSGAGDPGAVIPASFTRDAIKAAVDQVCAAGGGPVQLEKGTYVWPSGGDSSVIIGCNNFTLKGVPGTILQAPADGTFIEGLIEVWRPGTATSL